jgi:hypothetical protein
MSYSAVRSLYFKNLIIYSIKSIKQELVHSKYKEIINITEYGKVNSDDFMTTTWIHLSNYCCPV